MNDRLIEVAREIFESQYADAAVMFLAGSLVRGEGTAYSDLDLVVIFDKLPNAYRESFYFQNYPVEAFVHDPETLNYFLYEVDPPAGIPSLAQMISEGIEIPGPGKLSQNLKLLAATVMQLKPPILGSEDIRRRRYNITNLVDDLREPRSAEEAAAAGSELYQALADYYFRTHNLWSAHGKSIPRMLRQANAELCRRYTDAFAQLFTANQTAQVIALAEEILKPDGGFLFDAYKLEAPADWRKPLG